MHYQKLIVNNENVFPFKCKLCKVDGKWNDFQKLEAHYLGCLKSNTVIPNEEPVCH